VNAVLRGRWPLAHGQPSDIKISAGNREKKIFTYNFTFGSLHKRGTACEGGGGGGQASNNNSQRNSAEAIAEFLFFSLLSWCQLNEFPISSFLPTFVPSSLPQRAIFSFRGPLPLAHGARVAAARSHGRADHIRQGRLASVPVPAAASATHILRHRPAGKEPKKKEKKEKEKEKRNNNKYQTHTQKKKEKNEKTKKEKRTKGRKRNRKIK
jgi:hypothetical protein